MLNSSSSNCNQGAGRCTTASTRRPVQNGNAAETAPPVQNGNAAEAAPPVQNGNAAEAAPPVQNGNAAEAAPAVQNGNDAEAAHQLVRNEDSEAVSTPAEEENAAMAVPASANGEEEGAVNNAPQANGQDLEMSPSSPAEKICTFPFYVPPTLCGMLIGYRGNYVKRIYYETGISVQVEDEQYLVNGQWYQLAVLKGPERTIEDAIQMVRQRFPSNLYPQVRLDVSRFPVVPEQIRLPECQIPVELIFITNPGHIYVRQPEHWSYSCFNALQYNMTAYYQANETPAVTEPIPGDVYVTLFQDQYARVMVLELVEGKPEVIVRYLDQGGVFQIPTNSLKPLREEFFYTPFQATECAMTGIWENGPGWSEPASMYLSRWIHNILFGVVVYSASVPCIVLYGKYQDGTIVNINEEMQKITPLSSSVIPKPESPPQEKVDGESAAEQLTAQETAAEDMPGSQTAEATCEKVADIQDTKDGL